MNEKLGESPHRFQNSPHLDVRLDSLITGLHSKLFQREGKGGAGLRGEKKGEDVSGVDRKRQGGEGGHFQG